MFCRRWCAMFRGPVARAGSCGNASILPLLPPCPSSLYTCVSRLLSLARNATLVHAEHSIFFFGVLIHTASAPSTAGTSTDGGAVISKPGSAWLEGNPSMDHGMNVKRIHMQSDNRDIEHNAHQQTRNMDEEHTRGTKTNFLQIFFFIYLFVYIIYCVFNVFKL